MKEKFLYNGRIYTRDPESKYSSHRYYFRRKYTHNGKEKWEYLHRVIWSDNHGAIPSDCVVHHIDGDPLNNSIENLSIIPEYLHHRTFHHEHRVRKVISLICERCGNAFNAKTKKSRFCISCIDIIRGSSKESKKWRRSQKIS